MEPKFRLSPVSATLVSSRREGKEREQKRVAFDLDSDRATNSENMKMGPPSRSSEVVGKNSDRDLDLDKSRLAAKAKEEFLKGKALPYVDIQPIKASLRSPVSATVKSDQMPNIGPAYQTRAPVEIGLDIEQIIRSVLDLEISVPLRSLAGVSGQVQREIRKQVTKSRIPIENGSATKRAGLYLETNGERIRLDDLPVTTYTIMTDVVDDIPEGSFVAEDPILQYLAEHKDINAEDLIVAGASEPLRAIYMMINRVGQEECLLDNGSMIVSMARECAVHFGLTWDPSIRINMESASNHLEKTLGLARNVRFGIGGINVFLQVHVLEKPPYKILLGRPFDTFTSSVHKTNANGTSELVLTDPNTKQVTVVPTYRRGQGPEELQKQVYQGF
jgi:hypothetical protein